MKVKFNCILFFLFQTFISNSQSGLIDFSFRTDFDCNSFSLTQPYISPMSVQSDGKIVIGGSCRISFINGRKQDNLFRLNTDGTLDTTFKVGKGASNSINFISVLPNDKILISCTVSCNVLSFNGIIYPGMVLLNSDGSVDSNFHRSIFKHIDRALSIAVRNNEIAVYGFVGKEFVLLKFKNDGSLDTTFKKSIIYPSSSSGRDIYYLSDGRLILRRVDTANWSKTTLQILKKDGSKDLSFTLDKQVQPNFLQQIKEQQDGKFLLFGDLSILNGASFNSVVRLNSDGSLDKSFKTPSQLKDKSLAGLRSGLIQRDKKILLCGSFKGFDGIIRVSLLRLNEDGTLDTSFVIEDAFNNSILEIADYFYGKVLVSGIFNSYGSFMTSRVARINVVDQDDFQIYVFPNPGNGIFKVDANKEIALVVVTDFLGREIYRYVPDNPKIEINISDKARGTYFLTIFSNNQSYVRKILKL